jgi:chorismate mutase/prephenate dehydratase
VSDHELERLRGEVAAADLGLLTLVNRRLELVREIRAHKEANGLPFLDPGQEERLLTRLKEANTGPLSADGVEHLFREVLALIKRELG